MDNLLCFWTGFTGFYGSFLYFSLEEGLHFFTFPDERQKIMYIKLIPGPDLVLKIQHLLLSSLKNQ